MIKAPTPEEATVAGGISTAMRTRHRNKTPHAEFLRMEGLVAAELPLPASYHHFLQHRHQHHHHRFV